MQELSRCQETRCTYTRGIPQCYRFVIKVNSTRIGTSQTPLSLPMILKRTHVWNALLITNLLDAFVRSDMILYLRSLPFRFISYLPSALTNSAHREHSAVRFALESRRGAVMGTPRWHHRIVSVGRYRTWTTNAVHQGADAVAYLPYIDGERLR